MRQALSLALNLLEDTSSVVEALTGKPLGAFTVPVETAKIAPTAEGTTPPGTGGSSGEIPFFAGAEFMVEEIKSLLRKGRVVASAAAGMKPPLVASSSGKLGVGVAPVLNTSDATQLELLPPFPGRALDAGALQIALHKACANASPNPLHSPPSSKNTQLSAKLTGQAAQLSILTAELTSAQKARADAEASIKRLKENLSSLQEAQVVDKTRYESLVESLLTEVNHYKSSLASSGARAEAVELELGRTSAAKLALSTSVRSLETAVKEQVLEVERVRRECNKEISEAVAREAAAKGELERSLSRATHAEKLLAAAEKLSTGNMERLQGEMTRLQRELKLARLPGVDNTAVAPSLSSGGKTVVGVAGTGLSRTEQLEKELAVCQDELEDALTRINLAQGQETVLKGELRTLGARIEALLSLTQAGSIPLTYLRNVVVQLGGFCERPWAVQERKSLVNVLATMLDFDEEERKRACVPALTKKQQLATLQHRLSASSSPEPPKVSSPGGTLHSRNGGSHSSPPLSGGALAGISAAAQKHYPGSGLEDVPFSPPPMNNYVGGYPAAASGVGLPRSEQNHFRLDGTNHEAGQRQSGGGLLGMMGFV